MILNALVDYYDTLAKRGDISPLGWSATSVHYALNIDENGKLISLMSLFISEQRGKKTIEAPQSLIVPERVGKTSGIGANFLCENTGYVLGFDEKGKPERTLKCFEACKKLHLMLLAPVDHPAARAICAYFAEWNPQTAREHPALADKLKSLATANLAFIINGEFAHNVAAIRSAWNAYHAAETGVLPRRCLVTGNLEPIPETHGKIKGVNEYNTSLVSFNAPAFNSFEHKQCSNAPIGKTAAFSYVTAINHLLADRSHRKIIGDATTVFWGETGDPQVQDCFSDIMEPQGETSDEYVTSVMHRLAQGLPITEGVDMNQRFFVLGISPNAARLSVRFFWQSTFADALGNLQQHYRDTEIVRAPMDKVKYLSINALLYETININSKDKTASPHLSGEVMRAMLSGRRYPAELFHAVMRRIRADGKVTAGRVGIIKAYLLRENLLPKGECLTVSINLTDKTPAYVLGRMFAVLENIQTEAIPEINATIKDRFFSAACATPANVFPQIIKLTQSHIKKLGSEKKGLAFNLERELSELIDLLEVKDGLFPTSLSLEEQGLFIGGYYHQVRYFFDRPKKEETKNVSNN